MDDAPDAFLVLPGGLGTLDELFEVWTAARLGMHAKPVVVLDPDGFYDPLWAWRRPGEARVRPARQALRHAAARPTPSTTRSPRSASSACH